MKHVLQAFTMHIDGVDHAYDTEEVTIPIPTPMTEEYKGGGMPMAVNQPMGMFEALEATVKMAGHSPEVLQHMAKSPGKTTLVHFRGAVRPEPSADDVAHVVSIQGCVNGGSHDTWTKGGKSGLEFVINGIIYFKYEVADKILQEVGAYPPIWNINGTDELFGVNQILGIR